MRRKISKDCRFISTKFEHRSQHLSKAVPYISLNKTQNQTKYKLWQCLWLSGRAVTANTRDQYYKTDFAVTQLP